MANTTIEDVLKKHRVLGEVDGITYGVVFYNDAIKAMQEWATLQTPSNEKWVKASERLPEYLKKGFAKMSDYVPVRIYDDYEKRVIYSTARYCHDRKMWFDIMHNSENNNVVNPIEWLDESTPIPIQTPCVELEKEVERLKGLINDLLETGYSGLEHEHEKKEFIDKFKTENNL